MSGPLGSASGALSARLPGIDVRRPDQQTIRRLVRDHLGGNATERHPPVRKVLIHHRIGANDVPTPQGPCRIQPRSPSPSSSTLRRTTVIASRTGSRPARIGACARRRASIDWSPGASGIPLHARTLPLSLITRFRELSMVEVRPPRSHPQPAGGPREPEDDRVARCEANLAGGKATQVDGFWR
jgi:hypothetical protein